MRRGYTLIEIAVVMLLLASITGGGLVIMASAISHAGYVATLAKMDVINKALLDYSAAQKRIPCPARLGGVPSDNTYGSEAANPGSCTGGAPAADSVSLSGVVEGAVPVRALKLPDSYMYDGWGRKIRYAVDPAATAATGANSYFPPPAGGICTPSASAITVKDASGNARSTSIVYILLSHGEDGHGGYTQNGVAFNGGSQNSDELENCHCDVGAHAGANDGNYVQKAITQNPANAHDTFDDILDFRELWQMKETASAPFVPGCLYVLDSGSNQVQKYVFNTASWTAMSYSFNSPKGISVDISGNLWVADGGLVFSSVKKFSAATASWSTALSGLSLLSSVYVDNKGNIWLSLLLGGLVDKYNSVGSLLGVLLNGLSAPSGLFVDAAGNLWLCDSGNNRVLEFNGSVWVSLGGYGSTPGAFNAPQGIYVDVTGNVWVADTGNNRVQKYSGGAWTVYGGASVGIAAGQFNAPQGIAGDAYGNIWVADTGNRRVQEYSRGTWKVFATAGVNGVSFNTPVGVAVAR